MNQENKIVNIRITLTEEEAKKFDMMMILFGTHEFNNKGKSAFIKSLIEKEYQNEFLPKIQENHAK